MDLLGAAFEQAHLPFHRTHEPSEGEIGRLLRKVLRREIPSNEQSIAALFLADRLDHLQRPEDGILTQLQQGVHVLCDRYYFSSYAYHVPYVSLDWVIAANRPCAELRRPDLTLFLDISVEESLRRIRRGRNTTELFENRDRLTQVRDNYFRAFDRLRDEERIAIIPAEDHPDAVFDRIVTTLQGELQLHLPSTTT